MIFVLGRLASAIWLPRYRGIAHIGEVIYAAFPLLIASALSRYVDVPWQWYLSSVNFATPIATELRHPMKGLLMPVSPAQVNYGESVLLIAIEIAALAIIGLLIWFFVRDVFTTSSGSVRWSSGELVVISF